MTHDLLDELVADVQRQVVPDVAAAWRAGVYRRRRAYAVRCTAAVALAALVVGLAALTLDRPASVAPADQTGGVGGFPSLVPRPIVRTDVSATPGPIAAVLAGEGGEWSLVDASGRSWRVPDVHRLDSFPLALSDDGRWLGRLSDEFGRSGVPSSYVITDLITGTTREFPEVGDSGMDPSDPDEANQLYWVAPQAPGAWSPDDRWLLLPGGGVGHQGAARSC